MNVFGSGIIVILGVASGTIAIQDDFPTSPALDAVIAKMFPTYATAESIDERARRATAKLEGEAANVDIVRDGEPDIISHVPEGRRPPGISTQISVGVANADLIIKGIPLQRRSLPIADRTFLYSQYKARIAEVLSPNASVYPGETILIARPGGILMVDDIRVRAIDPDLPLFELNRPYYFILRQIPGTKAYRAHGSGTFLIEEGTVRPASETAKETEAKPEESFRAEVERAMAYRPWPAER